MAVVECAPEPGGAAVHTGTLPSKTLRETSVYLSGYHQRELYGISVEITPEHAAPRLLSRKDAVRQAEVARIRSNLDRHGVTMVAGRARFVDPHTIEIVRPDGVQRLTAEIVLIATGSIPHRPADIDFNDPDIEDSDTVLHLDRMPSSLTVLGAGVIGCEYATMFAALGVPVQLVEPRDHILPFLDEDIGLGLLKAMAGLGITPHLGDSWASARRVPGRGIVTTLKRGGEVVSDQLLFAAGRSGNTRGLGLETIGVKTGKRDYVEVDGSYRTSAPNVFAAGDCIGFPALASTSMDQARVAVCRAFAFPYKRQMDELLPYGIYTIPEVSCVGLSESAARDAGYVPVMGKAFYQQNARGQIVGDRDGMIKLVFDPASRMLIGCHCIGERATELVHIGQAVMTLQGTVETLIGMVFNYPTLSELYKYAAYDALGHWPDAGVIRTRP